MEKIVYILLAVFILGSINTVFAQDDAFFKKYPAKNVYKGEIVLPEGYRKEGGMIFNDINKAVDLTINYNGIDIYLLPSISIDVISFVL